MTKITFAAADGSLRNFGIAVMQYDTDDQSLSVKNFTLIETEKAKNKTVRASSNNFARAHSIATKAREVIKDCAFCFAEIPSGGQDYNAVLGFGIVIGIYASFTIPVIEVSPLETKMAAVGTRTASKQEMIEWACEKYPSAPWLMTKRNGVMVPILKNEHFADAVAIAHAGIQTPAFKLMTAMQATA